MHLLQARSAWLQRLCWPKAMAHWPANGEKSRNAVRVSPPGIHCQGQKVKIVLATVLQTGSAILAATATKFQMLNVAPTTCEHIHETTV